MRGETYIKSIEGEEVNSEDLCYSFLYEPAKSNDDGTWTSRFFINFYSNSEWERFMVSFYSGYFQPVGSISFTITGDMELDTIQGVAGALQETVSKWYFILRNLALLVLMLILIYSGIRIVIGSTAGEKAKYKERLMDWLIAMCLVFVMHYIMAFSINLVEKIIDLVNTIIPNTGNVHMIELTDTQLINAEKLEEDENTTEPSAMAEAFSTNGYIKHIDKSKISGAAKPEDVYYDEPTEDTTPYIQWHTDLLGGFRVKSQLINEGTAKWVGYSLCYVIIVIQTVFFAWTYLKRVLYMAFLTIIAPMVAMTYPIDKLTDGKAQAFDTWLKEYIFNLLIQPLHLLLFIILVSSAWELANVNPLYAIVALGFIMPAEKLLRRFFGFNKAQTPGMLGGAAGAALAFTGLQKIMNLGKDKNKKSSNDSGNKGKNDKIRFNKGEDPKKAIGGGAPKTNNEAENKIKEAPKDNKPELESKSDGNNENISQQIQEKETQNHSREGVQDNFQKDINNAAIEPKIKQDNNIQSGNNIKTKNEKEKPKSKKRIKRGFKTAGSMGKAYTRMLGQKALKGIKNAKPIRKIARGAVGLAGATAFGMAGALIGVAGGDPNDVFKYATAGAVGGYQAGKSVAGSAYDALSVNGEKIKEQVQMEWYGDEYKNVMLEKEKEALVKDEEKIYSIRKLTGASREKAQEMLKTTGGKCLESGITDAEDIATIDKMTKNGISIEKAIAAQKFNEYLPSDLNKMESSDRESHINQWAKDYEDAGYENPEKLAEESMKLAELFNKTKSGMKKA